MSYEDNMYIQTENTLLLS